MLGGKRNADNNKDATKKDVVVVVADNNTAIKSIRSCFKAAAFSIAVDVLIDSWLLWQQQTEATPVEQILEILSVLWKISFASGLFKMLDYLKKRSSNSEATGTKMGFADMVDSDYRIMGNVWGQTANIVALECLADIAKICEQNQAWLHPVTFAFLLVAIAVVVRDLSAIDTKNQFQEPMVAKGCREGCRRMSMVGRSIKRTPNNNVDNNYGTADMTVQQKVEFTAVNMALCVAVLVVDGLIVQPIKAWSDPTEPLPSKLFSLTDAYSPICIAYLLWQLRQSLLATYKAALLGGEDHTDSKKKQEDKQSASIHTQLYDSETKFYAKAAGIFRSEATTKILGIIWPFIQPVMEPKIEEIMQLVLGWRS